jgi:hypothetical protein
MRDNGFSVEARDDQSPEAIQTRSQVPQQLQSCHTAIVGGYIIEGHVPAKDVVRLIDERPDVVGLAVPGMPSGSPGMEIDGLAPEPHEVLSFDASGSVQVFASYEG